jgi:anaerobic ribonucleoside-triphosphate reductase activating protein
VADTIRISRIHYPVTVLGPGKRIGIWLQGCSNGCPGCQSKDTWSADSGTIIPISELVAACRRFVSDGVDGITISGGEPFEQAEALELLLTELHTWTDGLDSPVDYLCYSGKPYNELHQQYPEILCLLDVIIPEPFKYELPGKPLRGSGNQPIITLTELGAERFAEYAGESNCQHKKCIQFVVETDGSVSFIGIPERGEMQKLVELCKTQGLHLNNVSWE